ncbi:neuroguidin isoform X2 [Eurytemora carolleeae]|uniref:neuroguidin isoform X2 n=1 Tax=Eurytemora carolleeae TaxID=1294199 RepID=UPI000C765476|nr:neuroguidin isoform X2 [Eurytemora carolleeae]|eukprot:XP_023334808.1 neuroguidin-like isoform X2 [Eurytemora affinis]
MTMSTEFETDQGRTDENRTEQDRTEMSKLLEEIAKGAKDTRTTVQNLIKDIKEGGARKEGISFLDLKNRLLASYISNLGFLQLKKMQGKGLEEESAVHRLIEIRTVLEKIRPIDQKLRYQVDKLVNIAENGVIDENDPLRFKPNPANLLSKLDDESENEDEEASKNPSEQKFKPPMNVPQYYMEGRGEDKGLEEGEKSKKRAISKSIMESIKEQYLDTPEEVSHKVDTMRQKFIEEERERIRLEEDNFIRLPVTKADRLKRKQMMTMSSVGDDLTSFGKSFYDDQAPSSGGKKKRKASHGGKKSSKKFKKRKF